MYVVLFNRTSMMYTTVFLANERSVFLETFERLFDQPTNQHQHHLSIKTDHLVERYQNAIQELIHQYPTLRYRLGMSSDFIEGVPIPITITRSVLHNLQITENDDDRLHPSL